MVPRWCPTLWNRQGGGVACRAVWLCGGRCCIVAVLVIRASWGGLDCCLLSVEAGAGRGQDLPHEVACAARASSTVWMAGHACPANALIWWIPKTGHKLSVVGGVRQVMGQHDLRLLPAIQAEPPCR